MKKLLQLTILSLFIGLQAAPADAFRSCSEVFSKRPLLEQLFNLQRNHRELENITQPQEAVWALETSGNRAEANELLSKIEAELRSLESHRWEPEKWQLLSSEGNIHKVYRVRLNGISAVVKQGERPYAIEPLVYRVAKLLKVPVPLTIQMTIDGHPVVVQIFMNGWKTADLVTDGTSVEPNLLIEFFDHLIVNWDRNPGNLLVPNRPQSKQIDQLAIDSEFAFDLNDPAGILQKGANPFLLQNLRSLRSEFPDSHQAFLDPQVRNRVINLIEGSGLKGVNQLTDHMGKSLQAYENINRLYAD